MMPTWRRTPAGSLTASRPSMRIDPELGVRVVVRIEMVVGLPAPLGARRAKRARVGGGGKRGPPGARGAPPPPAGAGRGQNATAMNANAIVRMMFDSSEIGQTMSEIVAYGTAVVIEPERQT